MFNLFRVVFGVLALLMFAGAITGCNSGQNRPELGLTAKVRMWNASGDSVNMWLNEGSSSAGNLLAANVHANVQAQYQFAMNDDRSQPLTVTVAKDGIILATKSTPIYYFNPGDAPVVYYSATYFNNTLTLTEVEPF